MKHRTLLLAAGFLAGVGVALVFFFGFRLWQVRSAYLDLANPHPSVRAEAIWRLVVAPDRRYAQQLAERLVDDDQEVRLAAAFALIRLEKEAIRPILEVLKRVSEEEAKHPRRPYHFLPGDFFRHPSEAVQFILAGIARKADGARAVARLLESSDPVESSAAQQALRKVGPSVLPILMTYLREGRRDLRLRVIHIIGSFGDAGVDPLSQMIGEPNAKTETALDQETRQMAVFALGDTKSDRALPILERCLKDPMLEPAAWDAIARLRTKKSVAFLEQEAKKIQNEKPPSPSFVRALGTSNQRKFADLVLRFLRSPDDRIVEAAAYSAGQLQVKEAVPQLLRLLASGKASLVTTAALSLAQIREPRTLSALTALLRHPDHSVKSASLIAIQSLADRTALREVEALAQDPKVPDYLRSQAQSVAQFLREQAP
ncbi:MAG: HEAT repeat domain-containing protein [Armatimonadetes bacterium]|nr:HEAT repeat domain-containing protein [Armatimonadota bacterium]MDW8121513.1 HEAT repeat domain-containing protein [Armatimonadota bacterium]